MRKMNFKIKKETILMFLLASFALTATVLACLYVRSPFYHENFTIAYSQKTAKKFNLARGDYVFIWLSSIPEGMSGRSAQPYCIRFYVTSPNNTTVLDESLGIAGTGWFNPLSFMANCDGVYTMHFENTVGGNFDKTISLHYKIAVSIFGIPIEPLLFFLSIILFTCIILLSVLVLIERTKR